MRHFGLARESFYNLLEQIYAEHPGFKEEQAGRNPRAATPREPPSLNEQSFRLRARLGQILWDYYDNGGDPRHRCDVAEATGVPARGQLRAEAPPYNHDWTIEQMARLAQAVGLSFDDLMKKVVY